MPRQQLYNQPPKLPQLSNLAIFFNTFPQRVANWRVSYGIQGASTTTILVVPEPLF
ncbi:hypothetical protein H6F90_26050 [Trichocoleus sp. FACHB-591]|uniref:hypothetical protein n=1 Tax=Trichocoleus sp. FACHB-591 TaxID=2692872 RepID=UPI0016887881|nr:hypothetical protein [Trichocoleus sp. FACHB-591]MBD2098538.1 hypothetical protein [Trichocoleus sp. FACHB-591]